MSTSPLKALLEVFHKTSISGLVVRELIHPNELNVLNLFTKKNN